MSNLLYAIHVQQNPEGFKEGWKILVFPSLELCEEIDRAILLMLPKIKRSVTHLQTISYKIITLKN